MSLSSTPTSATHANNAKVNNANPEAVLDFWFNQTTPAQWFTPDPEFDERIRQNFASLYQQVLAGEHSDWRETAEGRLAEIIVLDQFSRNMFRDQGIQFQGDSMALALAQEAVRNKADQLLDPSKRAFLYMPFMHSESKKVHDQALQLFTALGNKENLLFETKHKALIDRFGRYPHRNKMLGRDSTLEEIQFLTEEGRGF